MYCVGGAGESAGGSGRISAAVSQTVDGGPAGSGRENEREVPPSILSSRCFIVSLCVVLRVFSFKCLYVFCRVNQAQSQPRQKRMPASRPISDYSEPEDSNGGLNPTAPPPSYSSGELTKLLIIFNS